MDWAQRVQKTTLHMQSGKEELGVMEEKLKTPPMLRAGTQAEFEQRQFWTHSSQEPCQIY
jgi:hypothetical protein